MTDRAHRPRHGDHHLDEFVRDLIIAHSNAERYANDLTVLVNRAREHALNGVRDRHCQGYRDYTYTIRRELIGARDRVVELDRYLMSVDTSDRARVRARALGRALDRNLALLETLHRLLNSNSNRDDDLSTSGAVELRTFMEILCVRGRYLALAVADNGVDRRTPGHTVHWTSHVANGMLRQAVRLVPAVHRARYDEEFRSELAGVAIRGNRWTQLKHAGRILARSVALRAALRGAPTERVRAR